MTFDRYRTSPQAEQPQEETSGAYSYGAHYSTLGSHDPYDPYVHFPVQDSRLASPLFSQPIASQASQASTNYQQYNSGGSATIASTDPYEGSTHPFLPSFHEAMYAESRARSQPPSRPPSNPPSSSYPEPHSPERFFGSRQYQSAVSGRAPSQYAHESGYGTEQPSPFSPPAMRPLLHRTPQQGYELPFGRTSASTLPARRPTGAQPLPNVGEMTSIPSSYSFELQPPPPPPGPIRTQRPQTHKSSSLSPVHHTRSTASGRRTSRPLVEQPKRRRPPDPYASYAHLLADIINQHRRKKMTLQDIYLLLKRRYSEHFPDDGVDDTKSGSHGGGWRVHLKAE